MTVTALIKDYHNLNKIVKHLMLCITLRMLYHGFPIITALSETVVEKPHKEAFGIAFLSRTEEHTSRNTLTI